MSRFVTTIAILTAGSAPAIAQDMGGAVDLGALSRTQVQSATARGYAERGGAASTTRGPNGVVISAHARACCEDYPNVRSRLGKGDARVVRLVAACRQAGYRYFAPVSVGPVGGRSTRPVAPSAVQSAG
ncbi:hypothetical protein [Sphingomonas sp. Leaf412]|uniref:hypothetical protein n=1 Tax=Sphingomonas sp. Leaf412 TaxID=1736370 RepID=UPI0019104805|nr:hypothetical protein [Sphingomonas sp. Leaf412]